MNFTDLSEIVAKAILFGSLQFTIANIESASKFSILSSVNNNEIMKQSIKGLEEYVMISVLLIFASSVLLYISDKWIGVGVNLIINIIIMIWIVRNNIEAHKIVADKYLLDQPKLFGFTF